MQKIIFFIKVSVIIACACSCKTTKVITGEINAVQGDTISIQGYRFKVLDNVPKINQVCSFTATRFKRKVNCILLPNY